MQLVSLRVLNARKIVETHDTEWGALGPLLSDTVMVPALYNDSVDMKCHYHKQQHWPSRERRDRLPKSQKHYLPITIRFTTERESDRIILRA